MNQLKKINKFIKINKLTRELITMIIHAFFYHLGDINAKPNYCLENLQVSMNI